MAEALVEVVDRLSERLGPREGELVPLSGGITNRNYHARLGGTDYVIRVPGPDTELLGIDREAEHEAALAAAHAGVGPEVALFVAEEPCLVTRFLEARTLTGGELRAPGVLEQAARALRAFHAGPPLRGSFSAGRIGAAYRDVARRHGVTVPDAYDAAARLIAEIEGALQGPEHDPVPCHNDLLTANFLLDDERLWIVDWEYAAMGDRYFDLGNLAVNNELAEADEDRLLAAYFDEPPTARRRACVRLMRLASDFREAMWGVAQQGLSDLQFDFVAYADEHFERLLAAARDPRCRTWLKEASGAQTT